MSKTSAGEVWRRISFLPCNVIDDLEVNTLLKEKIDAVLFSDLTIKKKRIEIKKLKRFG